MQHGFAAEKRRKRDQRAEKHAGAGGKSGAPDAEMEHTEEQKFQRAAQHRHKDIEQHTAADIAADAHKVIDSKDDGGDGGTEGIYTQILHGQLSEGTLSTHQTNEGRCCRKE